MSTKDHYDHHEIGETIWARGEQYVLDTTLYKELELTNYTVKPPYLPTYGVTTLIVVSRYWDDINGWYHGVEDPKDPEGLQYIIYGTGTRVRKK